VVSPLFQSVEDVYMYFIGFIVTMSIYQLNFTFINYSFGLVVLKCAI
jgi:hypothetical protein